MRSLLRQLYIKVYFLRELHDCVPTNSASEACGRRSYFKDLSRVTARNVKLHNCLMSLSVGPISTVDDQQTGTTLSEKLQGDVDISRKLCSLGDLLRPGGGGNSPSSMNWNDPSLYCQLHTSVLKYFLLASIRSQR